MTSTPVKKSTSSSSSYTAAFSLLLRASFGSSWTCLNTVGVISTLAIVLCTRVWAGLTGVLWPQGFFGLVPHSLAVLLQLVEPHLPPWSRANLHELRAVQKKIQIGITVHACSQRGNKRARDAPHRPKITSRCFIFKTRLEGFQTTPRNMEKSRQITVRRIIS